jgi:hypothetical protein
MSNLFHIGQELVELIDSIDSLALLTAVPDDWLFASVQILS